MKIQVNYMLVKRKVAKLFILLGIVGLCSNCSVKKEIEQQFNAVSYVDPNIGSVHCRWFFYTPASLPFGMAKLAPHTNAYNGPGWWHPQGYDDRHESIEGFGHVHEWQIGNLVFMPTVGELKTTPGSLENPDNGYRSRFSKDKELASPGYYSVLLDDYSIHVELTASKRVGVQKYTFPESDQSNIIVDIGHKQGEGFTVKNTYIHFMEESNEIEGFIEIEPIYFTFSDEGQTITIFFVSQLSKVPEQVGIFINDDVFPNKKESKDTIDNGMFLQFSTKEGETVEVVTGISYTSITNARNNIKVEVGNSSFEKVKTEALNKWNNELSKIKVYGGTKEDKIKFYTGLYHALSGRGVMSDCNGQYPIYDNKIAQIPLDDKGNPKYEFYNTDAIWGGFWNLGQLWSLAYPTVMRNYIQTSIDFYKERGWLHDGMAAGRYASGVLTNMQGLFIASAYNCGIRDFDVEKGLEAAIKNEIGYKDRPVGSGKFDNKYFVEDGFIPCIDFEIKNVGKLNGAGSHTLEYCFTSFAVAQFLKNRGREDSPVYKKLMKQSTYWNKIFDKELKVMRPLDENGKLIEPFDYMEAWEGFQEGNAHQYTFYVPHDVAGLIDVLDVDIFNDRLERTFAESQKYSFGGGKKIDSFSGIEKLYNHGNQPCLHQSWLFNYSGKPWLTQKWTRAICNEFYGTTPMHGYGYGQDEDQGQLGAWYVMASIGLFDVQGHTAPNPTFQFGSPLFERITIKLDNSYYQGKELVIETINNSTENIYVQSVSINGEALEDCWINRSLLTKGGVLRFEMGNTPNKNWGIKTVPPSMSNQ